MSGTCFALHLLRAIQVTGTADDFSTCLPTVVVADAKWCHELSQGGERRFGVGLRYQFPVL